MAGLKNLTRLYISGSLLSDISPLAGLKNLTDLELQRNEISDISPLAGLKNLAFLELQRNEISDVSPLAGLKNLTWLDISYNKISDFSPIDGLVPNLEVYYKGYQLTGGPAKGADPNAPVTIPDPNLRAAIEDGLGKAKGVPITVARIYTLVFLLAEDLGIKDLTGLEFATNLTQLYLQSNEISDVSPLAGLKNLVRLDLDSNEISDVSPLAGLKNLTDLDFSSNPLSDISPLSGLTNLTRLNLDHNQIWDISPLSGLTNLTRLNLAVNQIWDVSSLSGLTNLTELDLSKNQISDISPLSGLTNLTWLELDSNRISDFSPINGLIPNLKVYHNKSQRFYVGGCRTQMSADLEPLEPVRVTPRIERKTMSVETGASYGVTKRAVYSQGGQNRLWTPEDTVASSEEEKYSLVLTVEFLDGWKFEDERRMVEKAATAWALSGNILFKFVSSGKSDIRVRFDDKKTGNWNSNIGAPKGWDPEEHWNSDEHTMYLTTDLSYGIALHEFGHALGLTHEHLSPEFEKYFAWKFSGEELYNKISQYYSTAKPPPYQTPPTKKDKERMDSNILKLHEVDEEKSFFDIQSVMTYGLGDALLEILPAADQETKDVFARNEGIPDGASSLSSGDRKFIAQCYGDPIARAKISGKVRVDGTDKEFFKDDTIDVTKPIRSHIVGHHHLFHGREDRAMEFKWGGECRVEVYLTTRKIENQEVEVGVAALLYEGAWLDGGENTDDLEDIRCRSFSVRLGETRLIKISLKNVSWGARDIDSREISCKGLDIDFKDGGMRGDLIGGGGDEADVYVTVSASYVSTTFAAAAPSMIVASDTSVSETAGQMLTSDVNGDGIINVADLVLVSNYLGQPSPTNLDMDINGDGIVTIADLVQVARHLGTSTYSTYSSAPSRCSRASGAQVCNSERVDRPSAC